MINRGRAQALFALLEGAGKVTVTHPRGDDIHHDHSLSYSPNH